MCRITSANDFGQLGIGHVLEIAGLGLLHLLNALARQNSNFLDRRHCCARLPLFHGDDASFFGLFHEPLKGNVQPARRSFLQFANACGDAVICCQARSVSSIRLISRNHIGFVRGFALGEFLREALVTLVRKHRHCSNI